MADSLSLVRSPVGGASDASGAPIDPADVTVQAGERRKIKCLHAAVGLLSVAVLVLLIAVIALAARKHDSGAGSGSDPTLVPITILHVNDVYEVAGVSNGAQGTIARVATLKQQLKAQNPNTFMVLSGDLLSPSALSTAVYEGRALAGRQMVAAFNAAGLDFATFGNHEFDLAADDFNSRLAESQFVWISSNVFNATGRSVAPGSESYPLFNGCPPYVEYRVNDVAHGAPNDDNAVRIGMFGLTIDSTIKPYDWITNTTRAVQIGVEMARLLRARGNDIVVAITHQDIAVDIRLAQATSDIDIICAGHEHANFIEESGPTRNGFERFIPIAVADANARSAWIHALQFDTKTRRLTGPIASTLQPINYQTLQPDPATAAIASLWTQRAFAYFEAAGFAPLQTAGYITTPLDGTEADIRSTQTGLTTLVSGAMFNASYGVGFKPQIALVNSGSMRLDDIIPIGNMTQYDCLRVLPFGGGIATIRISGSLLLQVLNYGFGQVGHGAYLGWWNVQVQVDDNGNPQSWTVANAQINTGPNSTYVAAVTRYLLLGLDIPMLNANTVTVLSDNTPATEPDIRAAFIAQVGRIYPYPPPGGFGSEQPAPVGPDGTAKSQALEAQFAHTAAINERVRRHRRTRRVGAAARQRHHQRH